MRRLARSATRRSLARRHPKSAAGGEAPPAAHRFPSTRWSLVHRAQQPDARGALSELCQAYWGPICALMRHQGLPPEEAKDLTQGFFAFILQRNDLAAVDATRGRFRAWLCTCARNYLSNYRAHQRTQVQGGRQVFVSVDAAEATLEIEDRGWVAADRLFIRRWALTVVNRAAERLRARYQREGRGELFAHLYARICGPDDGDDGEATAELSSIFAAPTPGARRTERTRRKHQLLAEMEHCLRAEVGDTVLDPAQVGDELRELLDALD